MNFWTARYQKMKRTLYLIGMMALAATLATCAEEKETYVEGEVLSVSNNFNFNFPVRGDLTESGAEWYGFCSVNGDNLTFEVGDDDKNHINSEQQFYLLVANVKGPPQEGVWVDPTATTYIDDESRKTEFARLEFKNVYVWVIDDTTPDAYENCSVELFSTPGVGEHTPKLHSFGYFVRVLCDNLIGLGDKSGEVNLGKIEANLYFERCE